MRTLDLSAIETDDIPEHSGEFIGASTPVLLHVHVAGRALQEPLLEAQTVCRQRAGH